jgi:hypothetical protein
MALVLMLRPGDDFAVYTLTRDRRPYKPQWITLQSIESENAFTLRRQTDDAVISVAEGRSVELFRKLRVSVGSRGQLGLARVAIEAPPHIKADRRELFERKFGAAEAK